MLGRTGEGGNGDGGRRPELRGDGSDGGKLSRAGKLAAGLFPLSHSPTAIDVTALRRSATERKGLPLDRANSRLVRVDKRGNRGWYFCHHVGEVKGRSGANGDEEGSSHRDGLGRSVRDI